MRFKKEKKRERSVAIQALMATVLVFGTFLFIIDSVAGITLPVNGQVLGSSLNYMSTTGTIAIMDSGETTNLTTQAITISGGRYSATITLAATMATNTEYKECVYVAGNKIGSCVSR